MNWIDVKEMIPSEEGKYLCILNVDSFRRAMDNDPFYYLAYWHPEEKYFEHGCLFQEVTHWMPIPEMPQKDD